MPTMRWSIFQSDYGYYYAPVSLLGVAGAQIDAHEGKVGRTRAVRQLIAG